MKDDIKDSKESTKDSSRI